MTQIEEREASSQTRPDARRRRPEARTAKPDEDLPAQKVRRLEADVCRNDGVCCDVRRRRHSRRLNCLQRPALDGTIVVTSAFARVTVSGPEFTALFMYSTRKLSCAGETAAKAALSQNDADRGLNDP